MARFLAGADTLTLLPSEPGHATGPVEVDGVTAVGEVTLHNRASLPGGSEGCSDLELLVRLYRRSGATGLQNVEGMFVVAIRDGADLVLIRDHVGARTAFYTHAADGWSAGTSLRALRQGRGLDLAAVRSFLTFAYLPGTETLIDGVRELLPGRCMRLTPDGGAHEEVFWEPAEGSFEGEPVQALRTLLEEATSRRLPAGVPVAVLLSGGIDSSLVTALAAKLHDHPVHTYSISFGTHLPNELAYSGLVATHCNTRHRVLDVSGSAVASRLAETVALLDSPVGDPLTVPNLMLVEAVAADGHDVLLNGEGGDPVFGGPKNLPMLIWEMHRDDPDPEARAAAYLRSYRKCLADLPVLLAPDVLDALRDTPPLERLVAPYLADGGMRFLLNRLLHVNLRTKGAHHILTKVERLTAARGLQGRSPLFDRAVIDHAFAVPPTLKLNGTVEKWILKEAVRDLLPETIVDRPKSGMRVPVQQWLDGPLRDLTHDVLLGRDGSGLFRQETIRAWVRRQGALLPRQGSKLWLVLTLELWLRSYGLAV